jgi:hypothetical protein
MVDHLDSAQPIGLSDSEEMLAKLDNEALLAKFLDVNTNFISLGPLAQQFQELRYSQLRDELYRIDLEICRRVLWGTPEHKAAVKAAHDQAWQVVRVAPSRPQFSGPRKRWGSSGSRRASGHNVRFHQRGSRRQPDGRSESSGSPHAAGQNIRFHQRGRPPKPDARSGISGFCRAAGPSGRFHQRDA